MHAERNERTEEDDIDRAIRTMETHLGRARFSHVREYQRRPKSSTGLPADLLTRINKIAGQRSRMDFLRHRDALVASLMEHLHAGRDADGFFLENT